MTPAETAQEFEFEPEASALAPARRFLRRALREALGPDPGGATSGPLEDLADTLLMAANELASNAVVHARTEWTVRVVADAATVRVEVSDGNSRLPQTCLVPADATSGRGLAIVVGTGLQWGVDQHPGGKTIWLVGERPAA